MCWSAALSLKQAWWLSAGIKEKQKVKHGPSTKVCYPETVEVHVVKILWIKTQKVVVSIKWWWDLSQPEILPREILHQGLALDQKFCFSVASNLWSLYLLAPACSEGAFILSRKLAACFLTFFELPWQTLTEAFVKTCPEVLTKLCLESVQNLLSVMVIIWSEVLKLSYFLKHLEKNSKYLEFWPFGF